MDSLRGEVFFVASGLVQYISGSPSDLPTGKHNVES